ncbi:LarC family nickel insertion protein [Okeania sp. SIO1H5]|uniref:LarC family nickel insertion protein n=1 Tax=Okeania sp. SIO1H5 TaxID=2607777 RepID=UPI00257F5A69|nr:LarC family nickel insertion protein [Okeania sp. SIO1H5]
MHGIELEKVHFHEVGALDSIFDVVGCCWGFHLLEIEAFSTTPFVFGTGTVRTEHGEMPLPAPATIELTRGFPGRRLEVPFELTTPTGAALVTTLAKVLQNQIPIVPSQVAYGAGTRDPKAIANLVRLVFLETPVSNELSHEAFLVECNLDDMLPELVSDVCQVLLQLGCFDCWQESILMKKGRLATKLCVLCDHEKLPAIAREIAAGTSTGGLRYQKMQRIVSQKGSGVVETKFGPIRTKTIQFPNYGIFRHSPEYESCREASRKYAVPAHLVHLEATRKIMESAT